MTEHHLKTWPEMFGMSMYNCKPFEYRKNDRDFKAGDTLYLEEWNPLTEKYTGKVLSRQVTWILHGGKFGLPEGYCVMAVQPI